MKGANYGNNIWTAYRIIPESRSTPAIDDDRFM
jgi:hypothetical protein